MQQGVSSFHYYNQAISMLPQVFTDYKIVSTHILWLKVGGTNRARLIIGSSVCKKSLSKRRCIKHLTHGDFVNRTIYKNMA